MKKRTVITTEKREVWVISEGGVPLEKTVHPQTDASNVDGDESLTTADQDHSDKPLTEEQE